MAAASAVHLSVGAEQRVAALADVKCNDISELYVLGKELGQGRFSTVHLGTSVGTGTRVALKVVENTSLDDEENLDALEQEVRIMRMLDHPLVVKLKEVILARRYTYICMELLEGGELFSKIVDAGRYTEEKAKPLFCRLLACVNFMHSKNVVHRDLKPENVLFGKARGLATRGCPPTAQHARRAGACAQSRASVPCLMIASASILGTRAFGLRPSP